MGTTTALDWIIDFFDSRNIPYLICGGLAAIAYGSKRALNDIDIYVPENKYQLVVDYGRDYISYGPGRFKNEHWNVDYVQFIFRNQKIEVGNSSEVMIFDDIRQEWHQEELDFDNYTSVVFSGKKVRLMTKVDLIAYKSKLNREVDKIDLAYIGKE